MSGVDDQKQRHRCICALGVRAANKNGACKKFACYQSTILTMEKKAINRTLRRKKPEFDVIDMDEVITEKKEEEEMEVTKMGKISSN